MPESVADFLSDGDAVGRGPAIVMAKPKASNVRVAREGTLVLLEIDGQPLRFRWQDAILIGQWLATKGFEAKALDGDRSRLAIDPQQNRL